MLKEFFMGTKQNIWMRLGERAGNNLVSLSTDEAIKRIVALLRSAGDELDREVRELWTAGWG